MFINLLIFLIVCQAIESDYMNTFCNTKYRNNMITSVFGGSKATVYALRKEGNNSMIYPLTNYDKIWEQTDEAIHIEKFFSGITLFSFDSGFTITPLESCDTCNNITAASFSVTYIFSADKFYVYRELSNGTFDYADSDDIGIPWKDVTSNEPHNDDYITDMFDIAGNIHASFFMWNRINHSYVAMAYMVTADNQIYSVQITDYNQPTIKRTEIVLKNEFYELKAKHFGGAFVSGFYSNFVVNNSVYRCIVGKENTTFEEPIRLWDYFNCDNYKQEETNQTTITTTIETTNATDITTINDTMINGTDNNKLMSSNSPFIDEEKLRRRRRNNLITVILLACVGIFVVIMVFCFYFFSQRKMKNEIIPIHKEESEKTGSLESDSGVKESKEKLSEVKSKESVTSDKQVKDKSKESLVIKSKRKEVVTDNHNLNKDKKSKESLVSKTKSKESAVKSETQSKTKSKESLTKKSKESITNKTGRKESEIVSANNKANEKPKTSLSLPATKK